MSSSAPDTARDILSKLGSHFYERLISSALQEGASTEAIAAYMSSQGVKDPDAIILRVVKRKRLPPVLPTYEIKKLGGRNTFRLFFGLDRVEEPPVLDVQDRVLQTNERYAIMSVGNKMVVAEFDHDQIIELWPFDEFKKKLVKEPTVDRQPFADYWLHHPLGSQHKRLVYCMPGSREQLREGDYNGYQGFTVEPKAGDWSQNREHIRQIICAGRQDIFEWVLNWLAALFQLPGRHAGTAIVLKSDDEGTGKGHFGDHMVGQCFHPQQYLHLVGPNQLVTDFNEHFSGKSYVFADEACWGGDKQAAEKLKGLVTELTVLIHRKFLKAVEEPSALHIIMASNNDRPVAIPATDRRFAVLEVDASRRQDFAYFAALRHELDNGGRAAMLHELLALTIDEAALRQPPDTEAKSEVKELTLTPEQLFLQNWLANVDGTWTNCVPKADLYEEYKRALPRHMHPRSIVGFGKVFKKHGIEWTECKVPRGSSQRVNGYSFPSLVDCRAALDRKLGMVTEWPSDDDRVSGEPGSPSREPRRLEF